LGHEGHGLRAGAERPPLIRTHCQRLGMMGCQLFGRNLRMTNGAGLRTSEVLRRKKKQSESYQVKRPLYWNWRPR
jgi:hypothetical protein